MYYDRTVSSTLINELRPSGTFHYLASLARSQHLADLQLRGYPGKSGYWATLYVGLTKVIDVYERIGNFRLAGKIIDPAWDPAWTKPHPAEWFDNQPLVAEYVRGAIGKVTDRFTNEGAVQAMLCTRASNLFSVIDREAVIGFSNTASRTATVVERRTYPGATHDGVLDTPRRCRRLAQRSVSQLTNPTHLLTRRATHPLTSPHLSSAEPPDATISFIDWAKQYPGRLTPERRS